MERILDELNLTQIPQIRGLNKMDRVPSALVDQCIKRWKGIPLCAREQSSLLPLIQEMARIVDRL